MITESLVDRARRELAANIRAQEFGRIALHQAVGQHGDALRRPVQPANVNDQAFARKFVHHARRFATRVIPQRITQ